MDKDQVIGSTKQVKDTVKQVSNKQPMFPTLA